MNDDSIIYDKDNYVKLDEREKFRVTGDLATHVIGYLTTMFFGIVAAMFLFSFLPNLVEVFAKGYQPQFLLEYTFMSMQDDFFPKPSAIQEIPKVWAIPVVGAAFAGSMRMFYQAE